MKYLSEWSSSWNWNSGDSSWYPLLWIAEESDCRFSVSLSKENSYCLSICPSSRELDKGGNTNRVKRHAKTRKKLLRVIVRIFHVLNVAVLTLLWKEEEEYK